MASSVLPSLLLESMVGVLSRMLNIEAAESLALLVSCAKALDWEMPIAVIVKQKKTCTNFVVRTRSKETSK